MNNTNTFGFICFYDENKKYGVLKIEAYYRRLIFVPFRLFFSDNSDINYNELEKGIIEGEIVLCNTEYRYLGVCYIVNANGHYIDEYCEKYEYQYRNSATPFHFTRLASFENKVDSVSFFDKTDDIIGNNSIKVSKNRLGYRALDVQNQIKYDIASLYINGDIPKGDNLLFNTIQKYCNDFNICELLDSYAITVGWGHQKMKDGDVQRCLDISGGFHMNDDRIYLNPHPAYNDPYLNKLLPTFSKTMYEIIEVWYEKSYLNVDMQEWEEKAKKIENKIKRNFQMKYSIESHITTLFATFRRKIFFLLYKIKLTEKDKEKRWQFTEVMNEFQKVKNDLLKISETDFNKWCDEIEISMQNMNLHVIGLDFGKKEVRKFRKFWRED